MRPQKPQEPSQDEFSGAVERPRANRDLGPSSTAPGPQGVPVGSPVPPGPVGRPGVGRGGEFGTGQAASQDVSQEHLGHRGSPNHTYGYSPPAPQPGAYGQGRTLGSAVPRTDEAVAPVPTDATGGP